MRKKSGVQPRLIKTADKLRGGSTTPRGGSVFVPCTASVHDVREVGPHTAGRGVSYYSIGRHNVMDAVGMGRLCEFIEGPVCAVGAWLYVISTKWLWVPGFGACADEGLRL